MDKFVPADEVLGIHASDEARDDEYDYEADYSVTLLSLRRKRSAPPVLSQLFSGHLLARFPDQGCRAMALVL